MNNCFGEFEVKYLTGFILILLLEEILTNSASAIEYSDLHHKSKFDSKRLSNAKMSFINPTQLENKNTNDRLLKHDLLFHDMFVNDDWKKDFKVEFENEALSKKFINKDIDIFAGNYGYGCHGGATNKTQCSYGGVTLSDNNKYDDYKNIPCNLWIDGHQAEIELTAVKTKKKIVTIQELDVQLRNYLNEKYKLYEQGGDIVKGYVKYHNDDEQNIEYNFYNLNGEYGYEILKMYADNKTINSDKLHLDIYL
ncbi:exotoxin beta-grasp domain-containing protein, partial [Staphylococcus aureus]|nr:exotoxin beta-grasp domain-containing protein [Staphylococcus aureus]